MKEGLIDLLIVSVREPDENADADGAENGGIVELADR